MNDFELKTFKNANKDLNIIHIVSAIYQDAQENIESHVFYKDKYGLNALHVETYIGDNNPNLLTYEEKSKEIIAAIQRDKELLNQEIKDKKRNPEDRNKRYRSAIESRCGTIHEQLVNISFKGGDIKDGELLQEYKEKINRNIRHYVEEKINADSEAKEIFEDFLNDHCIKEEELEEFFKEKRAHLRYEHIKVWG